MVFSPTAYTVGQQRPKPSEGPGGHGGQRKRKTSEPPALSGSKVGRGKRNGAV